MYKISDTDTSYAHTHTSLTHRPLMDKNPPVSVSEQFNYLINS